ncbi:MAG: type II secretion system protein [Candidatus Shapirobacteria bacterium]
MKFLKLIKHRRGFTLVELLVAISIIAVLSAILLPNFMGARQRAEDAKKKEDLVAVKNALRMFYNDTQGYPLSSVDVGATLTPYLPNIGQIGFTYSQINGGDGFQLCVGLGGEVGGDNSRSQLNCQDATHKVCGIGLTVETNLYVVCGN